MPSWLKLLGRLCVDAMFSWTPPQLASTHNRPRSFNQLGMFLVKARLQLCQNWHNGNATAADGAGGCGFPACPLLAEWLRPVDGVAASSLSRIIANTAENSSRLPSTSSQVFFPPPSVRSIRECASRAFPVV